MSVRTDPYGTRPLFWSRGPDNGPVVADEIWELAGGGDLDPIGVADFLIVGYGLGERTIFRGVSCTEADSLLVIDSDGARTTRFPHAPPAHVAPGLDAAVEALEDRLLGMYEPYGDLSRAHIGLSGGLDSRVLLALAVERGVEPLAWTFAYLPDTEEEKLARRVAETLGVEHHVQLAELEELPARATDFVMRTSGQLSLEHSHGFGIHEQVPERFQVTVNGVWGDLAPGGGILPPEGLPPDQIEGNHLSWLLGGRPPETVTRRLPGVPEWEERMRELVARWYGEVGGTPRAAGLIASRNRPARFNVWALVGAQPELDYVVPFLDQELFRVCWGMEERWQRRSTAYREVISRRWPELAAIPWQKTGLPVSRYPGRGTELRRHIARRLRPSRPSAFTDLARYEDLFERWIAPAERELREPLTDAGIDLAGLLNDYPVGSPHGGALRLRLATVQLTLETARGFVHT